MNQGSDAPLKPSDFAWGVALTTSPGRALQTFVLPQSILEHCDLQRSQLSMFNAAGEVVPHAIRELADPGASQSIEVPIPLFPLRGTALGAGTPNTPTPPLRIQVQRKTDGTLTSVSIETSAKGDSVAGHTNAEPANSGPVVAYILDTSRVERGIESLRFELTEHDDTFIWPLFIATSNDLDHFNATSVRGSLASLNHAGHNVERRELPLGGLRAPYLRVDWKGPVAAARIASVTATLSTDAPKQPQHVREVEGTTTPGAPNERVFDLGATLPIEAFDLVLEKNSVIQAEVSGSPDATSQFTSVHEGTFYHLEHGPELLHNDTVEIARQYIRRIRVRVAPKGGGLGSASLRLGVHTIPEQVLFIARGEGPFLLAFGRAGVAPARYDASELMGLLGDSLTELPRSTSEAGPLVQLAGDRALVVSKVTNWKKLTLWAVLLLAVGLLAVLGVRLLRRVEGGPNSP